MKQQEIISKILHQTLAPEYHEGDPSTLAEADYYGASRVIADQLGLKCVPYSHAGWRHGWMHVPLKYVQQLTVWGKHDGYFLTAKEEHVDFLAQHGIKASAVGMPFIYANAIDDVLRLPNSLLVMPPHTLPNTSYIGHEEQYIREIEKIRHDFDVVFFCIHQSCYERGSWTELLEKYSFPFVIGASADQSNAIIRLQRIFSTFEFVTTNTVGSHLPYAAYCGAKVSICGEFSGFADFNFDNDLFAKANPKIVALNIKYTAEHYVRELVPFLFCEHPKQAHQSIGWAKEELGLENKRSAQEISDLLGWYQPSFQRQMAEAKLLRLRNQQKELDFGDVCLMLELARKHSDTFAIYGGGSIGNLILKILAAANLRPLCIFDQQNHKLSELNGLVVRDPKEILILELDLILVASFSSKYEIKDHIESIKSDVRVWMSS